MTPTVVVGVIEDHPVFLQGLAGLVEDSPDMELAFTARSVPEVERARRLGDRSPDVLLLDLGLAGGPQGADAVAYLRGRGSAVLVISASADRRAVVSAVSAGASGYLGKDAEPAEIVRAIRTVAGGGSYISPTLAGYLLDDARANRLTAREEEILRLLAGGETDLDIADELFISVHTVHSHLDRIRAKTGHHRRVDLTRFAIDHGLLPPSEA